MDGSITIGPVIYVFATAVAGLLLVAPAVGWLVAQVLPVGESMYVSKSFVGRERTAWRLVTVALTILAVVSVLLAVVSVARADVPDPPSVVCDPPAVVASGACDCVSGGPCGCTACNCAAETLAGLVTLAQPGCANGNCSLGSSRSYRVQPAYTVAQSYPAYQTYYNPAYNPTAGVANPPAVFPPGGFETGPGVIGTQPVTLPLRPVSSGVRAAVGHTHTCSHGHTWDHSMDGGSHRCPFCGEFQNVVSGSRVVTTGGGSAQALGAASYGVYGAPVAYTSGGCSEGISYSSSSAMSGGCGSGVSSAFGGGGREPILRVRGGPGLFRGIFGGRGCR